MTKTLDSFLSTATRPPEAEMADGYRKAVKHMDEEQAKLLRYLRVKDGKAVFLPEVAEVQPAVQAAEQRLQSTKTEVDTYLAALQDADSVEALVNRLNRAKRAKENLLHDINAVTERKVRAGMSAQQAAATEEVQVLLDKRDKLMPDLDNTIKSLTERIAAARDVLARYH